MTVAVIKITLNGSTDLSGIKSVRVRKTPNSPSTATINLVNWGGKNQFQAKRGDLIQIKASPSKRASVSGLPSVFYGFVSDTEATRSDYTITALDALGYLANEIIATNPSSIAANNLDAANIIKEIIGPNSYNVDPTTIRGTCGINLSPGLNLVGKTRLSAIQQIMNTINQSPKKFTLRADLSSLKIHLLETPDPAGSISITSHIAGRFPRTSAKLDFYPTNIDRVEDEVDLVNFVTVQNSDLGIKVSDPETKPAKPIERIYEEKSITDETQARLLARAIVQQAGTSKIRWVVDAKPERLDIQVGDTIQFASVEGGLVGVHSVFDLTWSISPEASGISMTVGRQSPDFVSTLRYVSNLSA